MPIDLAAMGSLLDVVSQLVVILGLPLALIQYRAVARREQRDREYGTYDELDDRYIEYQRMCLEYPQLDVWDVADAPPARSLTPDEAKQELQLLTILFAIFERAFLMYNDMSTDVKKRQWTGWEAYIASYCRRQNFRAAWERSGTTFETDFQAYMTKTLAAAS